MKKHFLLLILMLRPLAGIALTVIPPEVAAALKHAGNNRQSLEKVLKRYQKEPEKYKAACFLITHMPLYSQQGKIDHTLTHIIQSHA